MSKQIQKVFFPEPLIELNKEILLHPNLQEILATVPSDEFHIRMAHIAAYCEVVLDGVYGFADMVKLADILVKKLQQKRPTWKQFHDQKAVLEDKETKKEKIDIIPNGTKETLQ